ncbi:acyl-phosphate glycerol 3-phosphate acyltransferase [Paenibacillus sp. 598K]|uniref:glycerol-3-phosphate 1-O-acyltransferase PlsY n=1 Tax=Paenibacillus sp. 598K TaxID=1117987 RepID=UPI000FFA6724|nr:glycerol-3-phosphate 1-O-acyltransferase PlsY [Paenibacillus sp. 598K]GBF72752.1 acyl-phosphate glycerol 3-phosphate acyltransferase [Paenibacillus sp. 598K]
MILEAVLGIVISYLLGSIAFSIVIAKWVKGIDIRQYGSGNAGATNTLRVLGKGPAVAVLLLDAAKGIGAVLIGRWLGAEGSEWTAALCGLAAVLGHNWPIWFRFKGGKGIATTVGVMATLAFVPALLAGVLAILTIALTRYVSLGSLVFALLTPVFVLVLQSEMPSFWAGLAVALLAVLRHRKNLANLLQGTENKLGAKKGVPHGKT